MLWCERVKNPASWTTLLPATSLPAFEGKSCLCPQHCADSLSSIFIGSESGSGKRERRQWKRLLWREVCNWIYIITKLGDRFWMLKVIWTVDFSYILSWRPWTWDLTIFLHNFYTLLIYIISHRWLTLDTYSNIHLPNSLLSLDNITLLSLETLPMKTLRSEDI